jgi:hypothetical protein
MPSYVMGRVDTRLDCGCIVHAGGQCNDPCSATAMALARDLSVAMTGVPDANARLQNRKSLCSELLAPSLARLTLTRSSELSRLSDTCERGTRVQGQKLLRISRPSTGRASCSGRTPAQQAD